MSYWRVPLEMLEDPAELSTWAKEALPAATAAAAKPRQRERSTRRKPQRG
jgi:TfoX/Sxy family transcriptional regulator of competence genes